VIINLLFFKLGYKLAKSIVGKDAKDKVFVRKENIVIINLLFFKLGYKLAKSIVGKDAKDKVFVIYSLSYH